MYYITRMNKIDNVNHYEYLNTSKGKWFDNQSEAKGYKTFNPAQKKLLKVADTYRDYFKNSSLPLWEEHVKNGFLSLSFESDVQSVKNVRLDKEIV